MSTASRRASALHGRTDAGGMDVETAATAGGGGRTAGGSSTPRRFIRTRIMFRKPITMSRAAIPATTGTTVATRNVIIHMSAPAAAIGSRYRLSRAADMAAAITVLRVVTSMVQVVAAMGLRAAASMVQAVAAMVLRGAAWGPAIRAVTARTNKVRLTIRVHRTDMVPTTRDRPTTGRLLDLRNVHNAAEQSAALSFQAGVAMSVPRG